MNDLEFAQQTPTRTVFTVRKSLASWRKKRACRNPFLQKIKFLVLLSQQRIHPNHPSLISVLTCAFFNNGCIGHFLLGFSSSHAWFYRGQLPLCHVLLSPTISFTDSLARVRPVRMHSLLWGKGFKLPAIGLISILKG
jgi:hypothetical protein